MKKKLLLGFLLLFVGFIYFNNASWLAEPGGEGPVLFAHRAAGQPYDRTGLTSETCTAARMIPAGHAYLENTLPAMQAAFDYGAEVVEFDVHRTPDDRFAVFHDWTIDCRTEGTGITHDQPYDSLRLLDVGYGYTADGGQTYPFRGQGVGMMPSLEDVLAAFPDRRFMIDLKSQVPDDGRLLAERLAALPPARRAQFIVYGGGKAVTEVQTRHPEIPTVWPARLIQCMKGYVALGWLGRVPEMCANSVIMVPANYAPWIWGWPHRFQQRMAAVGSSVVLIGDYEGSGHTQGFDDPARLAALPDGFSAGIWTDRIDLLGPAVAARWGGASGDSDE